ncbi:MAG: T9SS type A sorting domain-containing protein [Vicingaceae bacterium]|nr:T9SS type A sorting domain-containing protein [Vicingaceae bacterium]
MKKSLLKLALGVVAFAFGFSAVAQTYTFTNCGATGRYGPTQTQVNATYTGSNTLAGDVTINTQGIQEWTVPVTGNYSIEAIGAEGGDSTNSPDTYPGKGAIMKGEFNLTQGTVLKILVGQRGGDAAVPVSPCTAHQDRAGGGGGGSFVTDTSNTPLIVAGGGNGDNWGDWNTSGPGALITNTGTGGGTSTTGRAGGGGGLIGDGQDYNNNDEGGHSFINGGEGGNRNECNKGDGGFGGGGGARYEGGGGGGYTGGSIVPSNQYNNTYPTFGAGSYNNGMNQVNLADTNSGHGEVIIEFIPVVSIDENIESMGVNIYPNPTNNIINISLDNFSANTKLTLTSIDGKVVYQQNNISKNIASVDLSNNSKGIYFLKVEANNQYKVYKVIKE